LKEPFPADPHGLCRETATLLISEAEPLPTELVPQGSVFLLQILDYVLLVLIDPASEDQHQKLRRQSVHRCNLGPATHE
jgi:hypothetical protein